MIFFLIRYAAYGVIGLEVLLLPLILDRTGFATLEYFRSVVSLGGYVLLGSYSGYMYNRYRESNDDYQALAIGGLLSLLIGGICFALYTGNLFYLVAAPVAGYGMIAEKRLQVANKFTVSILYRPITSVFVLGLAFTVVRFDLAVPPDMVASIAYALAMVAWIWFASRVGVSLLPVSAKGMPDLLRKYGGLVRRGFLINCGTVMLALYLFLDRYILRQYRESALADYSLAFNIAQLVFVGVNTISLVATVKMGEDLTVISEAYINRLLRKAAGVLALLWLAGLGVSVGLGRMLEGYDRVIELYAILAFFVGGYYATATVSSVLLYRDRIIPSTLALGMGLLVNGGLSLWAVPRDWSAGWLLAKSGVILLLTGCYNLYLVYGAVQQPVPSSV